MKLKRITKALIVIAMASASLASAAAAELTAVSNKPANNTFIKGEVPQFTFTGIGLPSDKPIALDIHVVDEFDKTVEKKSIKLTTDQNGIASNTYTAPASRYGFYKINASFSDGTTVAELGSKPAGFVTYCVVMDPSERREIAQKDAFFFTMGWSMSGDTTNYLGGHWNLTGADFYKWRGNEPKYSGQFAETRAKYKAEGKPYRQSIYSFTTGTGENRKPWKTYEFVWLFNTPDWAIEKGSYSYTAGIMTPDGEKAWVRYCRDAAAAYAEDHPDETEHLYQITWEPHYPWGFKGTEEQLIRIYELAYPALHEVDPKAVVVGPTGSHFHNDWHESLLKKGLGKYLDGFAIHPYCDLPGERNNLIPLIRQLKEIIRRECGRDLPLYGTEQGGISTEEYGFALGQAQCVIREHLIMLGEGYKTNLAFLTHDYSKEAPYGYYYNTGDIKHAFMTKRIQPKPAAPAYAALTSLFDGYKTAGAIEWFGKTTLGYSYEIGDDVRLALWDFGDEPREITIPVGREQVRVSDWMGNIKTVLTAGGFLKLTLGKEPWYILDVSPKLWGSHAERPLTTDSASVTAFPGTKTSVRGKISAPANHPLDAMLTFTPDAALGLAEVKRQVNIAAGGSSEFDFDVEVANTIKTSGYSAILSLVTKDGHILAGAGSSINVSAPLQIGNIVPAFSADGKSKQIHMIMNDHQGNGIHGTITGNLSGIPESDRTMEFSITPGQSAPVVFDFGAVDTMPQQTVSVDLKIATNTGFKTEESQRINFMAAPYEKNPIRSAADLSGWNTIPALTLAGREYILRSPQFYEGEHDLSATMRYAWDEKNLYYCCVVTDDAFMQEYTDWNTWDGDCIQLDFDLDPFMKESHSGNTLADKENARRFTQISLALTKSGVQAYRTLPCARKGLATGLIADTDIALAITRNENEKQTIYQVAIPWTTLGADRAPECIGIAAEVNDRDEPTPKPRTDVKGLCLFQIHKTANHGVLSLCPPVK